MISVQLPICDDTFVGIYGKRSSAFHLILNSAPQRPCTTRGFKCNIYVFIRFEVQLCCILPEVQYDEKEAKNGAKSIQRYNE